MVVGQQERKRKEKQHQHQRHRGKKERKKRGGSNLQILRVDNFPKEALLGQNAVALLLTLSWLPSDWSARNNPSVWDRSPPWRQQSSLMMDCVICVFFFLCLGSLFFLSLTWAHLEYLGCLASPERRIRCEGIKSTSKTSKEKGLKN